MSLLLPQIPVALMVAGGFAETEFTELQRALAKAGAAMKTISADAGLVNGWQGTAQEGHWGHYFPVDAQLGDVLAADLDALVIVSGDRSITKLKSNMNTARILRHMLDAHKPVVLFGNAITLLEQTGHGADAVSLLALNDIDVTAPEAWVHSALNYIADHLPEHEAPEAAAA